MANRYYFINCPKVS